jgi:hypothetical protein
MNGSFGSLLCLGTKLCKPPRDFFAGNDLQPLRHPMFTSFPIVMLLLVKGILISSDAANM